MDQAPQQHLKQPNRLLDGTVIPNNGFVDAYRGAFQNPERPFLHHYAISGNGFARQTFSAGQFWRHAQQAASVITEMGCAPGDCLTLYMTANRWQDLAFRLAATMTGAVPVTINWQADTIERIVFKIERTESKLILFDDGLSDAQHETLEARFPSIPLRHINSLTEAAPLPESRFWRPEQTPAEATRIVVFTSGTTGHPKGVALSYQNYALNRGTFESFLQLATDQASHALIVNPMHHTNSTAISDWHLRRPNGQIHLFERYATAYWQALGTIATSPGPAYIAPLVARHFDYLHNLSTENRLPIDGDRLRTALDRCHILIGSAPVGPTTISRHDQNCRRLPLVRFGSTETCLQVAGTPTSLPESSRRHAFERGWAHQWQDERKTGFYIGQDHFPFTEVAVVRSVTRENSDFLSRCAEGEPGYLITRGNAMRAYVADPNATADAYADDWYLRLGDIGFWLSNPDNGKADIYWLSRESAMLIRGGANYAYQQINDELETLLVEHFELTAEQVEVATVGLRIESEHEDSCCVTVALSEGAAPQAEVIQKTFLTVAREHASKGARPDHLRVGKIPKNFKGAVLLNELKKRFETEILHNPGNTR